MVWPNGNETYQEKKANRHQDDRIPISKFNTKASLQLNIDDQYVCVIGKQIKKKYARVEDVEYLLEKIKDGYVLTINININNKHQLMKQKLETLMEYCYDQYSCYFKSKLIDPIAPSPFG